MVVGIDGSPGGSAAAAYVLADAARRGGRVRAVWAFPQPEYWAEAYGLAVQPSTAEIAERTVGRLQAIVDEITAACAPALREVPVETVATAGSAAAVLVEEAADADLLVVGHRGRGALGSTLLGSVGLRCVLHAPCPVTVVPGALPTAERGEPAESAAERDDARQGVPAAPEPVGP